jgi:putative transposase
LGKKGRRGILKSQQTRMDFLQDETHPIRLVYIPKHTSGLNQIERWFSILVRRLLKHGNFSSVKELKERLLAFIDYFNHTMAKDLSRNNFHLLWASTGQILRIVRE